MNNEELRDLMPLYVLGQLDEDQERQVRDQLQAGSPMAAAHLAEAEATLASLPLTLDPIAPPEEAKAKLMARIGSVSKPYVDDENVDIATKRHRGRPSVIHRLFRFSAAAALTGLITWAVMNGIVSRKQQQIQNIQLALAAKDRQILDLEGEVQMTMRAAREFESDVRYKTQTIRRLESEKQNAWQMVDQLQNKLRTANQTVNLLRSPRLTMASLDATGTQPVDAWGRLFWDHERKVWHFYTAGMKPAGAGKTYELWIITADHEKIPAGTFDVDEAGRGTLVVNLPPEIGPIAMAAVTDEPAGGVPQPTGSIQLAGGITIN